MFNKFILSLILFCSSLTLLAYDSDDSFSNSMTFAVKAGTGLSTFIYDIDRTEVDPIFVYKVGASLTYLFSPEFAIQPELLFATKGAKHKDKDFNVDISMNLNYLEIPILLKYIFEQNSVYFGPYIGVNLSAKGKNNLTNVTVDFDNISTIDFGVSAGYERFFTKNIAADIRINYGLTSIEEFVNRSTNILTLLLGVGYYF